MNMRIDIRGVCGNAADRLAALAELSIGDTELELIQWRDSIFMLREIARHADMVMKDESRLREFAELYCLIKTNIA